jgi:hypothetical protein
MQNIAVPSLMVGTLKRVKPRIDGVLTRRKADVEVRPTEVMDEKASLPEVREAARHHLPITIVLAVFVIALGCGALLLHLRMQPARSTTVTGLPGAQPPHVRGSEKARVHVEQFEDFQCANCAALEPAFQKIERDYGTKLRITFREFPLPNHEHAMAAAEAAEAAGLQNHFLANARSSLSKRLGLEKSTQPAASVRAIRQKHRDRCRAIQKGCRERCRESTYPGGSGTGDVAQHNRDACLHH